MVVMAGGGAEARLQKIPSFRSKLYWDSFLRGGISVFLTILPHIPTLIFVDHTKIIFFFRSRKQTKCIWYIIGELSITYIFLGAFSAVRVIIRLRGRCFSCSEYLGPMISPPSQYFLPLSNLKLEYFSITKPKGLFCCIFASSAGVITITVK